jgi:hypothetical protein
MREPDTLRERAAQLRALAIKAREDGKPLLAAEITKLAIETSDQADEMDRHEVQHQPAQPAQHHQPAQQQQQPPSSEADKPPDPEGA